MTNEHASTRPATDPESLAGPPSALRTADLAPPSAPLRQAARWGLVALSALGWWVSLDLLNVTRGRDSSNPLIRAQCGDAPESDCLSVLRSERARFGARPATDDQPGTSGIPWAAVGMGYFAFLGVWYAFVGFPDRGRRAWLTPVMLVLAIGLFQSLLLIKVMALDLHRWCAGCLTAHAVNAAIVLLTVLAAPWGKPSPREAARRTVGLARPTPSLALATLGLAFFAGYFHLVSVALATARDTTLALQNKYTSVVGDAAYARWHYSAQTYVDLPIRDDDAIAGPPDAPNTAVVFVDFQCPQCRTAHASLRRAAERCPGALRVVYRHFPQDSACNPHYPMRAHPAACRAAAACEAARIVGGTPAADRMRQRMYDRQDELELDRFADWAAEFGLDQARFTAAMESDAVRQRILDDAELGKRLDIRGLPVIYLNGRKVEGWSIDATWDALLSPATQPAAP